jgi:hypothetical protein
MVRLTFNLYLQKYKLKKIINSILNIQCYQQQIDSKMEIAMTDNSSNSRVGKWGIKKMNKKDASVWFQNLSPAEQSLLKQQSKSTSSSPEERKPKKEMHKRERELLLKRRSEHEARMKAQLQSKTEITQQIQKCQQLRSQLIPLQMRLEQMKLHELNNTFHECAQSSSQFIYKLGMLGGLKSFIPIAVDKK